MELLSGSKPTAVDFAGFIFHVPSNGSTPCPNAGTPKMRARAQAKIMQRMFFSFPHEFTLAGPPIDHINFGTAS
jgi:hypothetical protein